MNFYEYLWTMDKIVLSAVSFFISIPFFIAIGWRKKARQLAEKELRSYSLKTMLYYSWFILMFPLLLIIDIEKPEFSAYNGIINPFTIIITAFACGQGLMFNWEKNMYRIEKQGKRNE